MAFLINNLQYYLQVSWFGLFEDGKRKGKGGRGRFAGKKHLQSHSQVGSDTWWLRNNMAFPINNLQYYLQVSVDIWFI